MVDSVTLFVIITVMTMNTADLHVKIADCEQRLDAAHADEDRQHLVPDITFELATLRSNRAELERRLAA
jgi:pentose-5-phosphate-3-epimerase